MLKRLSFVFCCLLVVSYNIVEAATTTVNLGSNIARVTTGSHVCKNGKSTEVTFQVNAVLNKKSSKRTNFGSNFKQRMDQLDSVAGDHKGHILASAFGGPAVTWNLAPQADHLNTKYKCRNSMLNIWYDCEKFIRQNLDKKKQVSVKISLRYQNGNCRPTHWSIDAQAGSQGCQALDITNGPLPLGVCQKA
ncbi:hypothetical protein GWI33_001306 [Rhynchophorus ferrugineus]|uniref:Type VII secretion system protein EssD-like domain-containing protein n=1 Tax=Rhynchophorus ferrugineus TaxID=354439 RepID=A0A834IQC6_RHYFE|nr:hypothetical protein GWI33_001306 [Rhynchophorus ferrugineus]